MKELEKIPGFFNIGKPIHDVENIIRINNWNDWAGPFKDSVQKIASRQEKLHDKLMKENKKDKKKYVSG